MVDTVKNQTYTNTLVVNEFRGLNLRESEDYLSLGDSAKAQNLEIATPKSLSKKKGTTNLFSAETFRSAGIAFRGAGYYTDKREVPYYLGCSYPFIHLISPDSGYARAIYSGLMGIGEGSFIKGGVGESMYVDGANKPVLVSDGVATAVTWPPVYTNQNNSILYSQNAQASNPTTYGTDIGNPSLGVYFNGRYYLAGDNLAPQRLYSSKIRSADFSDNTQAARINVAFFVDIMTNSPIIGLKVISNKYLVIFCRNEIHVLVGKYPPTAFAPEPQINIDILNPDVGLLGKHAFCDKGNNDIFFLSNRQALYTLTSTDNFQDVRPRGLSFQIYPAFEEISIPRFSRARLVDDSIKGELQIWFPDSDKQYYPNKRFLYNYEQDSQRPAWSEDIGFDISLRGAFTDRSQNKLILVDRDKLIENGVGVTYDGQTIDTQFQLAPLDFGDRDRLKQVLKVEVAYKIDGGGSAVAVFEHLWDNGIKTGLKQIRLVSSAADIYDGDGVVYDLATYSSGAGNPINTATFEMLNPEGRVLKMLIRCQSDAQLTIVDIKFRYKLLGKDTV